MYLMLVEKGILSGVEKYLIGPLFIYTSNKMKKTILILLLSIATNLIAQKDTLYFNSTWNKCSKKEAKFYRPIPLKKRRGLYQVKNDYSNGNLQMEGCFTNVDKEILEGIAIWYSRGGKN